MRVSLCYELISSAGRNKKNKQTSHGRSTQSTNSSDPTTSTSELLLKQNSATAHVHQSQARRLESDHCATQIYRPKSAVRPISRWFWRPQLERFPSLWFHQSPSLTIKETFQGYFSSVPSTLRQLGRFPCLIVNLTTLFLVFQDSFFPKSTLLQWYSTFFIRVLTDVISLQVCTPQMLVYNSSYTQLIIYI
jgi:hypothetical protein